jgi:hypothetical protein
MKLCYLPTRLHDATSRMIDYLFYFGFCLFFIILSLAFCFHLDNASKKDYRLWNYQCKLVMLRSHHNTSLQTISKQIKYRKSFKRTEMKSTVRHFIITTYRLLVTVYDSRRPVDVNFISEAHSTHTSHWEPVTQTALSKPSQSPSLTSRHFHYYNVTTTPFPTIHSSYALQRTYWHLLVTKTGSRFNCLNDQSQFHCYTTH